MNRSTLPDCAANSFSLVAHSRKLPTRPLLSVDIDPQNRLIAIFAELAHAV